MIREQAIRDLCQKHAGETSDEALRPYAIGNPLAVSRGRPVCVIRPKDVPALQEIIRTAVKEKFGLVPVSSGGPHVKGGTACDVDHAVVDLSHWKGIPWVNRRNRVCIVEPGVTYGELNLFLKDHGMTLPVPLAPRSTKSVIAAVIDREPHTWPRMHWDMQDPVASTEFIYGTGELFRSGAAGGPGSLEDQRRSGGAQKMPMGPGQSDFQRILIGAQGSMGVMTWISLRTELLASVERPMLVTDDRLDRIIEYVYRVQRPWLGEETFVLNRTAAAMLMTHGNPASFARVRGSLPEYVCLQNCAGFERLPKERLEYQFAELKEYAGECGLPFTESAGEVDAAGMLETARTTCGPADWRHAAGGHCLSVFFLSLLNKAESFISIAREAAGSLGVDPDRIGLYLQPVVQNHACHMEFMVPYDPAGAGEIETMKKLEAELTVRLMAGSAFFSRPYGTAAQTVFKNNPGNTGLLYIIKDLFDPAHVLSPGRFSL